MRGFKNIIRNKLDFFIITSIIIINLLGVNIVFNILFNGYVESKQIEKFSKENIGTTLNFNEELSKDKINNIMKKIDSSNIPFSFTKKTDLKGGLFDVIINLHYLSTPSIYDYEVKQGRNITLDDIKNNRPVIVISNNYKEFFYKKGENFFILIDDVEYEIIGIIENTLASDWYRLKAFTPYDFKNGLDLTGTTRIISFYTAKDLKIPEDISNDINEITYSKLNKVPIYELIETIVPEINYYLVLGGLSIFNLCLFFIFFIRKRKSTISILRAVGYTKTQAGNYILKQILIIGLLASFVSWLIYYPFSEYFNNKFVDIGLIPSILILVLDILFSLIILFIISKITFSFITTHEIQNEMIKRKNILNNIFIKGLIIIELFMMFNYVINLNILIKDLSKTLRTSNKIIDFKNTLIMDGFSVSSDPKDLENYNVVNTLNDLQQNGLEVVNYLYAIDTSEDVHAMNNKEKEGYEQNYEFLIENIEGSALPILYISNSSLDVVNIKGIEKQNNHKSNDETLVYAGSSYKDNFKVGDVIEGDSGEKYKIAGFINKNQYMFGTNSSSKIIDNFNNLDNFIIIPFEINDLDNMNVSGMILEDKRFYTLCNSLIKYSNENEETFAKDLLNKKGINLSSFDIQLRRMRLSDFSYAKYKLFGSIIISIITLISLICYIIFYIYSEKRNIGIKRALGYNTFKIMKEYILKIALILGISNILILLYKNVEEFFIITKDVYTTIIFIDLFIILLSICLIFYCIKKDMIAELIKEKD